MINQLKDKADIVLTDDQANLKGGNTDIIINTDVIGG